MNVDSWDFPLTATFAVTSSGSTVIAEKKTIVPTMPRHIILKKQTMGIAEDRRDRWNSIEPVGRGSWKQSPHIDPNPGCDEWGFLKRVIPEIMGFTTEMVHLRKPLYVFDVPHELETHHIARGQATVQPANWMVHVSKWRVRLCVSDKTWPAW